MLEREKMLERENIDVLYKTSETGDFKKTKEILNKYPQLINKDSPLYLAAGNGHLKICNLLIENGADVNQGGYHNTPLYLAARNGHFEICNLLIENGVDINKGYYEYATPLCIAVQNGHFEICNLLIEKGADINKGYYYFEKECGIPLNVAAENAQFQIFKLLIEKGAHISNINKSLSNINNKKILVLINNQSFCN
eukprot:TRINITY_DN865_c0_g1_i1.p1 TRINITY_DN865_c0_g1~~TRINITY_DN865_c0_g1_i1.p1  ORF type:complete len:217 (-),score=57.39 TRINITY_DN865_c0_g1_i1:54-641(-)